MFNILEKIVSWALSLISAFGYGGIFLTMGLESALVPIPSEIVLPFSGFLASTGRFNLWLVVAIATLANLTGALVVYWIGFWGGQPVLERYGRFFLIHKDDISKMDSWLEKYEARIAFFSRLLPGVRTFSSLIIGVSRVNVLKFITYTVAGSFIWNLGLAYIGFFAGEKWNFLVPYFRRFEIIIGLVIILGIIYFVYQHLKRFKRQSYE